MTGPALQVDEWRRQLDGRVASRAWKLAIVTTSWRWRKVMTTTRVERWTGRVANGARSVYKSRQPRIMKCALSKMYCLTSLSMRTLYCWAVWSIVLESIFAGIGVGLGRWLGMCWTHYADKSGLKWTRSLNARSTLPQFCIQRNK